MLDFCFDFICISESKLSPGEIPKIDITIEGYQPPVGTPTEAGKGGVLIYAKNSINFKPRPDLNIYKAKELESCFIEVVNDNQSNSIVGVIYRHPCMAPKIFNDEYLLHLTSSYLRRTNRNILRETLTLIS